MSDIQNSASQMIKLFRADSDLVKRLKEEDPLTVLEEVQKKAEGMAWKQDTLVFRIAVIVLGLLALIAAVGSIILVSLGLNTPEVLVALGSAAVGALVGLFASSPSGK